MFPIDVLINNTINHNYFLLSLVCSEKVEELQITIMGFKNCEIQLFSPQKSYYAGETVSGQLKFDLQEEKKVRGRLEILMK